MRTKLTPKAVSLFESIKNIDENGNEYWTSRSLWKILEYTEYRHFLPVIEKAKLACKNSGQKIEDHFEDILEMIVIGKGGERQVDSVKGLYGGITAKDIHAKKGLKKSQKILDHMGSTELAANLFRATQTEEKLKRENIKGKQKANMTHYEVGAKVRQTIKELGGTMPEDLPTAENIKAVEKKKQKILDSDNKELL